MSEVIRKVLESQQAAAKAVNGVPAAAPQISSANVRNSANPDKPEARASESVKTDERLDEDPEVQEHQEIDPEAGNGEGNEPEAQEENEEEHENASADSKKHSKSRTKKRMDELLKERKIAESKLEKAEQRIQELEEQAQAGSSAAPARKSFTTMEEVDSRRLEIRKQLRVVNTYIREGGYTDKQSGDTMQVEELEKLAADLEDERDLTLPEMADKLRDRERIDREQVAKLYPDLLDEDSDLYEEAEELFAALPELRSLPEGRLWVGRMLKGRRMERVPAKSAPAPQKSKAPTPPREPGTDGTAVRTSVQPPEPTNGQQELLSRLTQRMLARTQN